MARMEQEGVLERDNWYVFENTYRSLDWYQVSRGLHAPFAYMDGWIEGMALRSPLRLVWAHAHSRLPWKIRWRIPTPVTVATDYPSPAVALLGYLDGWLARRYWDRA